MGSYGPRRGYRHSKKVTTHMSSTGPSQTGEKVTTSAKTCPKSKPKVLDVVSRTRRVLGGGPATTPLGLQRRNEEPVTGGLQGFPGENEGGKGFQEGVQCWGYTAVKSRTETGSCLGIRTQQRKEGR